MNDAEADVVELPATTSNTSGAARDSSIDPV
jgi:hypothetical protein